MLNDIMELSQQKRKEPTEEEGALRNTSSESLSLPLVQGGFDFLPPLAVTSSALNLPFALIVHDLFQPLAELSDSFTDFRGWWRRGIAAIEDALYKHGYCSGHHLN